MLPAMLASLANYLGWCVLALIVGVFLHRGMCWVLWSGRVGATFPQSGATRHVLVTGCDSGFGHELALKLHSMGFYVHAGCLFARSVDEFARSFDKRCVGGAAHASIASMLTRVNLSSDGRMARRWACCFHLAWLCCRAAVLGGTLMQNACLSNGHHLSTRCRAGCAVRVPQTTRGQLQVVGCCEQRASSQCTAACEPSGGWVFTHINNHGTGQAGINAGGHIEWTPIATFQKVMDVDYLGGVRVSKAFLDMLVCAVPSAKNIGAPPLCSVVEVDWCTTHLRAIVRMSPARLRWTRHQHHLCRWILSCCRSVTLLCRKIRVRVSEQAPHWSFCSFVESTMTPNANFF